MPPLFAELLLESNRLFARMQINAERRLRLYRELAGFLKSGYSRGEALEILWKIASRNGARPNEPIAIFLGEARNGLQNGLTLSMSFKAWIPQEDHMLLMAIEDNDALAEQLETWCTTLESRAGVRADAAGALVYPGFLMVIAYGLLIYFDKQIMPALSELLPQGQWTGMALWFQTVCSVASDYVLMVAMLAVILPTILLAALPHWSDISRDWADRLPIFALYRSYSGLAFLQSMGALMASGLSAPESIQRIRDGASPYSRQRLERIRQHLLNGQELGDSMLSVAGGWPDLELALSVQALGHAVDFPAQIARIGRDWRRVIHQRAKRLMAIWRLFSFLAVFAVVSGVVTAMYEIQSQIAANIH